MKSPNSYGIASLLAIQAVCANVLFTLTPSADARATSLHTSFAPLEFEPALSPAAEPWSPIVGVCPVATDTSIVGVDDETVGTLSVLSSSDQTRVPAPTVIRSTGSIEGEIDVFRALLGGNNNAAIPGQQAGGRREINWDGVPAAVTNVPNFPNAFFNTNSPRGLVYEPTSPGLEVSNQSFIDVNPAYDGEFVPFSGQKTFSPIGSNATDIVFFVAGSNTKAAVRGIGVVFVDVDKIGATSIELLGENGLKLGHFTAPVRSDRGGASFLGIVFRNPVITHVHIVTGDARLAANEVDISNGGQHDLVVMDDFIYGEPTAIGN